MSNKLFNILDGLLDADQENINDVDMIEMYADGCGEVITREQAEKIQEVGKKWLDEQENGNGEWSRMRHEAIAALEEDE